MKVIHRLFAICFLSLIVMSCQDSNDNILMNDVKNQWNKNDAKSFDFNIDDAHNQKNIIFIVRNNADYPYSNLRLITELKHNQKVISTDTLNYILAKPNGEWLGSGFGDTKEILFQYKLGYKFPSNGKYSFKVVQAMRQNTLIGIEDLGINIQNIKP